MALTAWSTSNYLRRLSAVVNGWGYALDGWAYVHTLGAERHMMFAGEAANDHYWNQAYISTGNNVFTQARTPGGGTDNAGASGTISADAWFYFTSVEYVDLREAYLNAGGRGASTFAYGGDPTAADRFYVGTQSDATGSFDSAGALGELAVWNLGSMTQGQRETLWTKRYNGGSGGNGANPLAINAEAGQPHTGALVAYWRLTSNSDLTDLSGNGHDLSMVGTLTTFGTNPPVDPVSAPQATNLMGQICL